MHLLECCDEQLRMDLFRNRGGTLAELTQDEVLKAIEVLAVRKENMRVARDPEGDHERPEPEMDSGGNPGARGGQGVGRRSIAQLSTPQTIDAVDSTYKKLKRPMQRDRTPVGDVCPYCGGVGHGRNAPARVRRAKCPAFGKVCSNCGKENHLAKVCRSSAVQEVNHHVEKGGEEPVSYGNTNFWRYIQI